MAPTGDIMVDIRLVMQITLTPMITLTHMITGMVTGIIIRMNQPTITITTTHITTTKAF